MLDEGELDELTSYLDELLMLTTGLPILIDWKLWDGRSVVIRGVVVLGIGLGVVVVVDEIGLGVVEVVVDVVDVVVDKFVDLAVLLSWDFPFRPLLPLPNR